MCERDSLLHYARGGGGVLMAKPITIKINVTRIDKALMYKGKNGTYLDVVLFENKNGVDQYGNTHTAYQGVTKEQRDQGIKGPIIGNAKIEAATAPRSTPPPASEPTQDFAEQDIPF